MNETCFVLSYSEFRERSKGRSGVVFSCEFCCSSEISIREDKKVSNIKIIDKSRTIGDKIETYRTTLLLIISKQRPSTTAAKDKL